MAHGISFDLRVETDRLTLEECAEAIIRAIMN